MNCHLNCLDFFFCKMKAWWCQMVLPSFKGSPITGSWKQLADIWKNFCRGSFDKVNNAKCANKIVLTQGALPAIFRLCTYVTHRRQSRVRGLSKSVVTTVSKLFVWQHCWSVTFIWEAGKYAWLCTLSANCRWLSHGHILWLRRQGEQNLSQNMCVQVGWSAAGQGIWYI